LAVLLLKQIFMFVLLEPMFQHDSRMSVRCWIQCSNILARFNVPCILPVCTRAFII